MEENETLHFADRLIDRTAWLGGTILSSFNVRNKNPLRNVADPVLAIRALKRELY